MLKPPQLSVFSLRLSRRPKPQFLIPGLKKALLPATYLPDTFLNKSIGFFETFTAIDASPLWA
jgi:hypothetical protein